MDELTYELESYGDYIIIWIQEKQWREPVLLS